MLALAALALPRCTNDGGSEANGSDAGFPGSGAPATGGAAPSTGGKTGPGGTIGSAGVGTTGAGGSGATGGGSSAPGGASGVANSGGAPPGSGGSTTDASVGTGGASSGGFPGTGGASTGGRANGTGGALGGAGGASSGGAPPGSGGRGSGGSPSTGCLSSAVLNELGKSSVLIGASMSDATATSAPFDLRYLYLAGGIFDGQSPCQSCATGCTDKGVSCANSVGCAWWGCWQYDQDPPGGYARGFFGTAVTNSEFPMITYYQVLPASGAGEGAPEVAATNDVAFMQRYIADWRFLLDQVAGLHVFLHIEPDFWGYAEQVNSDPHAIPAAVASANSECSGFENSIAGLGRCMIDMVRRHAPSALVGLHGSGWATKVDALQNRSTSFDVSGEAAKLGAFLSECGATDSDYVVVDASDRDAAWYESQGQDRWWDATNATLPNFHQAFAWAKALAERVGKPIVWWQLPVGNMSLGNTNQHWQDNRVDYFFDHMDEVAAAHGVAALFGAGDGNQTTPETDGGHLVSRVKAYAAAPTPACP